MSYYTYTLIEWDDSDRPQGSLPTSEVLLAAKTYLMEVDWPLDALRDLERGLAAGGRVDPGFVDFRGPQVIDMFRFVSETVRDVTFYVRGLGEEIFDVWVASMRDGAVLQEHGPFDE